MKFLISLFLIINLYAKVIDKIEILVDTTPITSYDIQKTQKQLNIDKQQAISYLIDKALFKSAIKQRGIYVDDFDIDKELKQIAQKNGMSLFNFKNYLLQKGKLDNLKTKIKQNLEKTKLIESLNVRVNIDDVKSYYQTHKAEFTIFTTIDTTQYSSENKDELIQVMQNPLSVVNGVEIKDITFNSKTNPRLLKFLSNVNQDSFSPIINLQGKFTSFYIIDKKDKTVLPLKAVENEIYAKLMDKKAQNTLTSFIAKLKAKADIQFFN